jgi:hypothetical protein
MLKKEGLEGIILYSEKKDLKCSKISTPTMMWQKIEILSCHQIIHLSLTF